MEFKKIVMIMGGESGNLLFQKVCSFSNVVFKINIDSFLCGFLPLENKIKPELLDFYRIVGTLCIYGEKTT